MSLFGVITGTFFQLMLMYFIFMIVVFSGSGLANGRSLGKISTTLLNVSMFALPSLCLISAGIIIYLYSTDGSVHSYGWHSLPFFGITLYFIYFFILSNK